MSETLQAEINNNIVSGNDNPAVSSAIDLIKKSEFVREEREQEWSLIQEMFDLGFEVSDPRGARKLESQLLYQAVRKVVSKMKTLDVSLHATGATPELEKIVTDGVATVLEEGGYNSVMRDKFGVFYRIALFGDAFVRVGTIRGDMDKKTMYPIKFQNTSLLNVYVDPYANQMRSPTSERDVDELVAIYVYSWDEAVQIYPELSEKGAPGKIKRRDEFGEDMDVEEEQELEISEREVEIAHYYNRSKKRYTVFAGSSHTVLIDEQGDEYRFMKDNEPYIPFLHFMFDPKLEGFYNAGLGHTLYRLAILTRQLDNMAVNYGFDNVSPIRMVNVPSGEKSKFFNRLLLAQQAVSEGKKGFVVNEYGVADPRAGQVSVETFQSQPLTQEWERLYLRLEQQIKRLGINLDEIDRGRTTTATQIIAEEENADQFVKQVMEQNAGEFKFVWELSIEMIKEFITKNNKTPINMTTSVNIDGFPVPMEGITLGMLSEELKDKEYFVKVNARSGAIPSRVLELAQITRALQVAPPGSPAFFKLAQKFMAINDQDVSLEDLGFTEQGIKAPAEQELSAIPSETDELSPRSTPGQPLPSIA